MGKIIRNYDNEGNLISKECSCCHKIKPVSEFNKCKSKTDGLQVKCKECVKKYKEENKNRIKGEKNIMKRNYDDEGNLISKECSCCHEIKSVSEFNKAKRELDGLQLKCKECLKEYYQKNKERIKEYYQEYRQENKESIKEYRQKNKESIKEYNKQYQKDNAERIKERQKQYNKDNAERIKEYYKEYYKDNVIYFKEHNKEYNIKKVKEALQQIKTEIEKEPEKYDYNPNFEIYGIIYLVHNTKSDKYYVGQTTIGFDNRYNKGWLHDHEYKDTVKEDLTLYGENTFEYTKIFKVAHSQHELDKLEAYYINYYDSYENGYNETRGNIFTDRGKEI